MDLPIIELTGTSRQMGQAFGEQCRDEIHTLYHLRLQAAQNFTLVRARKHMQPKDALQCAKRCLPIAAQYAPDVYDEFLGIAQASGLAPEALYLMQGLTDLRDFLAFGENAETEGCSHLAVLPDASADQSTWVAQNWDLQTNNMPFVRLVYRKPAHGPQTWSLTLVGCLSLIGLNEHGIAIGNTNLSTSDARIGVHYLFAIHQALGFKTARDATNAIAQTPRAGAHFFYITSPVGAVDWLECSATCHHHTQMLTGFDVQCNHALHEPICLLQKKNPSDSSHERDAKLRLLRKKYTSKLTRQNIQAMLADRSGGDKAICRDDVPPGISTNACVIMSPQKRVLYACRGQGDVGKWVTCRFD